MSLFKRDMENEMSGGQVFGYILIIAAIVFILAFGVFVGLKKLGINTEREDSTVTTSVEQTEDTGETTEESR